MKRREPFFKKSHRAWYVEIDRKQIRLATDEAEAWEKYHELMTARKKAEKFVTPGEPAPVALGDLLDQFLASAFKGKSDETRRWYADKLTPFVGHYSRAFIAVELKPFHVDQWIAAHSGWSAGTARNMWRAVQRLCRGSLINDERKLSSRPLPISVVLQTYILQCQVFSEYSCHAIVTRAKQHPLRLNEF